MDRDCQRRRDPSSRPSCAQRVSAALAVLSAVISFSSSARAAGLDETCGLLGSWSEECSEGLECEGFWSWLGWSLGTCVAIPKPCGADLPEACSDSEYCAFEGQGVCGFAGESGVCKPQPTLCVEQYQPVCGCNGRSYANPCSANSAGTAVQHEGLCPECTTDADCPYGVCDVGASCAGSDCPPPPPNRCTVCGDGSRMLCRRAPGPCPEGQVREVVDSCHGRCVDRVSCAPMTCVYGGETYPLGASFPAADGCNECSCSEDGHVECTLTECTCDYAAPTRQWVARSREACQAVRFTCMEGQQPFFDACGCGCESIPAACEYEGQTYPIGASFPDADGCNTCRCAEDGSVQCTLKLCACNYEDPTRSWVSHDADACATILFACPEDQQGFVDECGCGCEPTSDFSRARG